jgi:hypothetical protein
MGRVGMTNPATHPSDWWQASDGNWYPPEAKWTGAEDAYLSAAQLANSLRQGVRPPTREVPIVLGTGEGVFYSGLFDQYNFATASVSYNTGWFAAFGSPLWLAASLGGSALYNNHQKNKARDQAAAQWRIVNQGTLYLTNSRVCLQGRLGWVDIPLSEIRALECLPDGVVVYQANRPPTKIATAAVAYLYVLLSFLVHGQVVDVPLSEDFIERARSAGRSIPQPGDH